MVQPKCEWVYLFTSTNLLTQASNFIGNLLGLVLTFLPLVATAGVVLLLVAVFFRSRNKVLRVVLFALAGIVLGTSVLAFVDSVAGTNICPPIVT